MSIMSHTNRLPLWCFLAASVVAMAQTPPPAVKPVPAAAAAPTTPAKPIFVHAVHKEKLGDGFDCSLCHVAKEGSPVMQIPGHTQCNVCHQEIWDKAKDSAAKADTKYCGVCHKGGFPTPNATHTLHLEKLGKDGFECNLCHVTPEKDAAKGMQRATHAQCTVCHQEIWDKAKDSAAKADTKYCGTCHVGGFPPPNAMHSLHLEKLGKDGFECNLCHATPEKDAAKGMQRGTHAQCTVCHQDAWDKVDQKFCTVCHAEFPPTSAADLRKAPANLSKVSIFHKGPRDKAILFEFSHTKHVDPKARTNAKTGFRADCTFCHKFDQQGVFATFPGHVECASCHSAKGSKPMLSADSTSADCQGCHKPTEIENPGFTKDRRFIAPHVVSGTYVNLKFNHQAHFRSKEKFNLDCTKCHYAIPQSNSLATLTLPKMVDCVECHDTSKSIVAEFKMSKCATCHVEPTKETLTPASHTRNVKPGFHTTAFRRNHSAEATEPGAKCFVCHQNVTPSQSGNGQCSSCHSVMRPVSHTARWKEDIHGKFASIERESCATCHTSDTCSRCHNQAPASHLPFALFLAGRHQRLAMLDERACFTCHTFQNTCSRCHIANVKPR